MERKMEAAERKAHLRKMFANLKPEEKAEILEVLSEPAAQTKTPVKPENIISFQSGFTLRQ